MVDTAKVLSDLHSFIESVELVEEEFKGLHKEVLDDISSLKNTSSETNLTQNTLKRLIKRLEVIALEKGLF